MCPNLEQGYWLLFNALVACIVICRKLQVDVNTRATHMQPYVLGEIDFDLEMCMLELHVKPLVFWHLY